MSTKLQLALDGPFEASLDILRRVAPAIDIVEIGTPLIFREGVRAVSRIRQLFPDLEVLADLKIMDAGRDEASIAFEAGADLVTVLGVTQDNTVRGAVEAAQRMGKQVLADLMQVADSVTRGSQLLDLGCDYLCVHTAYDLHQHGHKPLADLERLRRACPAAPLAVAGGIRLETLGELAPFRPAILIVGGAITGAADPAQVAQQFRQQIEEWT
jgi:3-hexulose-6-phosphate synthase